MTTVHDYFSTLRSAVHRARNDRALRKIEKSARNYVRKIPRESRDVRRKAQAAYSELCQMIRAKKRVLAF
jgi:hypothetical protein